MNNQQWIFLSIGIMALAVALQFTGVLSITGGTGQAIAPNTPSVQGTLENTLETYLNGWNADGQQVQIATVLGRPTLILPWLSKQTSDVTSEANLHVAECGAVGTFSDSCMVTDESSEYLLGLSMSRNTTLLAKQAAPALSLIQNSAQTMNDATGQPYGITQSWVCRNTINPDHTASIYNCKKDPASDAEARTIIAEYNFANNPSITDTTLKANFRSTASQECSAFRQYFYNTASMKDPIDGRTINHWLGGGGNVARGISNSDFAYTGYFGDAALAMEACAVGTKDNTYYQLADETLEQYLIMANWTPTTGLQVPACKAGSWRKDTNGYAVYTGTTNCPVPAGTDDADAVRFTSVCAAYGFGLRSGITVNNHIGQYCNQLLSSTGYAPTAWSVQWYTTGLPKSVRDGGPHGTGLGGYVDLGVNPSNLAGREQALATQFSGSSFRGQQSFGIYWGGFDIVPLGYGLGRADATLIGGSYAPATGNSPAITPTPTPPQPPAVVPPVVTTPPPAGGGSPPPVYGPDNTTTTVTPPATASPTPWPLFAVMGFIVFISLMLIGGRRR